jgi:uncharacterized protein YkwD
MKVKFKQNLLAFLTLFFALNLNAAQDRFEKATLPKTENKKISIQEATLKAINQIRTKNQYCAKATTPLAWNKDLYNLAKEHSIDMAVNNFLSHEGSGTDYDVTAKRLGLKRGSKFYERVNQEKDSRKFLSGELVLAVDKKILKTPKEVINFWMKKENNCKVIMDPRFINVALSKVISNKTGKAYWTLLLLGGEQKK